MTRARQRRGFALITVLWVLGVLALLAAEFAAIARTTRVAAANTRTEARARWAARAGLARGTELLDRNVARNLAGYDLAARGDTALPALLYDLDGASVLVIATDARARINVNRADAPTLAGLFDQAGLPAAVGDSLADAILDWRDRDDFRRARGAEAAEYRALRPPVRARNAPFDDVEDLRSVWGMSPARYALVAPYLTVAGDGRVGVNSASLPVLQTLPGIDEAAARAIVARRARAPFRGIFDLMLALPQPARSRIEADIGVATDRMAFAPRELELRSVATVPGGGANGRAEIRATVVLAGASSVRIRHVSER
jgi:general secretion pathway protein K